MDAKKPYVPLRFIVDDRQESPLAVPHSRRLYTRYDFVAEATVITSNEEISSEVRNISLGGCLVLVKTSVRMGAEVTVKISRDADHFEATARVVHSSESHAGLVFGRFVGNSLFVLSKWVAEAKSKSAIEPPHNRDL